MPVINIEPIAIGSSDEWTLAAGSTKPVAVATDDGTTTYIQADPSAATKEQNFTVNTATIPSAAVINSVTLVAVVQGGINP